MGSAGKQQRAPRGAQVLLITWVLPWFVVLLVVFLEWGLTWTSCGSVHLPREVWEQGLAGAWSNPPPPRWWRAAVQSTELLHPSGSQSWKKAFKCWVRRRPETPYKLCSHAVPHGLEIGPVVEYMVCHFLYPSGILPDRCGSWCWFGGGISKAQFLSCPYQHFTLQLHVRILQYQVLQLWSLCPKRYASLT